MLNVLLVWIIIPFRSKLFHAVPVCGSLCYIFFKIFCSVSFHFDLFRSATMCGLVNSFLIFFIKWDKGKENFNGTHRVDNSNVYFHYLQKHGCKKNALNYCYDTLIDIVYSVWKNLVYRGVFWKTTQFEICRFQFS